MDVPKLWTAILSGQYNLANELISRGANVNEPTMTKYDSMTTLLHYAVLKTSNIQCIRMLANLGANFDARDSEQHTPLHWAAACNANPDVVEVLINEGADVNARDQLQLTPLHHAAIKYNCIESAKKLITMGASIDAISAVDWSVLHVAVIHHNLELVKILISYRVNVDAKDIHGFTPLLCYFTKHTMGDRKTEIIQLLLDNGADVNSKSDDTVFSLLFATELNSLASVYLLLKNGARINEATDIGYTALHVACKKGLADMTALLLKFGADLNMRNWKGETPFELLPNNPFSEATAQIIISEAVKREALGQFLCEGYKQMAQSCENYSKFEKECREEVKRMQSEKFDIEDSAISFFHIFSMDKEMLTGVARNEKIVMAFESSGYVASFRIYASELTTKFEEAKKRAILPAPIVQKLAAYAKYSYMYNRK